MAWEGSRGDGKAWQPPGWAKTRRRILERDGHRCYVCGGPANEVDHVRPIFRGGGHDDGNLRAICRKCHATKSGREGAAARPRARREPERHPGLLP
jgi:5-methylcytosine-specific restriction endonuclease McrA